MKLQLFYPIKPITISQKFGVNEGADYKKLLGLEGHPGEDLISEDDYKNNISYGRNVRAAHRGTVLSIETDTNGGYTIVCLTDNAYEWSGERTYFKLIYAHCIPGSAKVKVGDFVEVGDVLAICGVSGIIPQAEAPHSHAHVHFGLKPAEYVIKNSDGTPLNPYWGNSEQDNGYGGAVDHSPYWTGLYAKDYIPLPMPEPAKEKPEVIIQKEITLLQKVVEILQKLFNIRK